MPTTDVLTQIINDYGLYILVGALLLIGLVWFLKHRREQATRHDYLVAKVKTEMKEYSSYLGKRQKKVKLYWYNDEIGIIKSRSRHSKPLPKDIDEKLKEELIKKKYMQFETYKDNLFSKIAAKVFNKTETILIPEDLIENPNFDPNLFDQVLQGSVSKNSYHAIFIKQQARFTKFLGVWIIATPEMVEYIQSIAFKDGYEKLLSEIPPLATNAAFINNRGVASDVAITENTTRIQEEALKERRRAQR